MIKYLSIALILLFLTACDVRPDLLIFGKSPTKDIIYGKYVEKYKYADEAIIINHDFTYEQTIVFKSNKYKSTSVGKWKFSNEGKYLYLIFDGNFMSTINWMGDFNSAYERHSEIETKLIALKVFNKIRLGDCAFPNLCYKKVNNEQKDVQHKEKQKSDKKQFQFAQ